MTLRWCCKAFRPSKSIPQRAASTLWRRRKEVNGLVSFDLLHKRHLTLNAQDHLHNFGKDWKQRDVLRETSCCYSPVSKQIVVAWKELLSNKKLTKEAPEAIDEF